MSGLGKIAGTFEALAELPTSATQSISAQRARLLERVRIVLMARFSFSLSGASCLRSHPSLPSVTTTRLSPPQSRRSTRGIRATQVWGSELMQTPCETFVQGSVETERSQSPGNRTTPPCVLQRRHDFQHLGMHPCSFPDCQYVARQPRADASRFHGDFGTRYISSQVSLWLPAVSRVISIWLPPSRIAAIGTSNCMTRTDSANGSNFPRSAI